MHDIRIRHARVRILNITASKREVFGRRTPPSGEPLGAVQLERTKFFRGSADRSPKNGRMRTHISHAQPCIDTALRKCNALLAPDGRLRAMYADTRTRAFWTPWPSQAGLCPSGYVPWLRAQPQNDSISSDIFRVGYILFTNIFVLAFLRLTFHACGKTGGKRNHRVQNNTHPTFYYRQAKSITRFTHL